MSVADYPASILVVKLSAIGDVIHALPVAYALKKGFPGTRITWVVEKPAYDLVANNPFIDEVILFDKPKFKSFSGLLRHAPGFIGMLKSRRFDVALDLQAIFKGAIIAYLSGAPRRFVYCNTREMSGFLSRRICGPNRSGHVVQQYLDVVRAMGCEVGEPIFPIFFTEAEKDSATKIASCAGLDVSRPFVVLSPGANWLNKRWPPGSYSVLADRLYREGVASVLTGGPGDNRLAEEVMASTGESPVDLTGKTTLKQLAYIISKARAFVGGDTGPMHLAAALATPVVALYGPTDIIRNGPYGSGHKALVTPRDCTGCWKRKCPRELDCLESITVDAVFAAVGEVLRSD